MSRETLGRLLCLCYERRRAKSPRQMRLVVRSSTGSAREGCWCTRIWTRQATVTVFRHRYCSGTLIGDTAGTGTGTQCPACSRRGSTPGTGRRQSPAAGKATLSSATPTFEQCGVCEDAETRPRTTGSLVVTVVCVCAPTARSSPDRTRAHVQGFSESSSKLSDEAESASLPRPAKLPTSLPIDTPFPEADQYPLLGSVDLSLRA